MSRIAIPAVESATGATADIYTQVKKIAGGRVKPSNQLCRRNDIDLGQPVSGFRTLNDSSSA